MQRISVFIPEEIKRTIDLVAKAKSKPESEVIREALDEGLARIYPQSSSAQRLLDLAKLAKRVPTKGTVPADFIENLDYYTWGGVKREQ